MLLTINGVMRPERIEALRADLEGFHWRDGRETTGAVARAVKRNEQADLKAGRGPVWHKELLEAISGHSVVSAAARPKRFTRLLLSRTRDGGGYGAHVDNGLMGSGADRIRSDISFTLFLSDPQSYEGGELTIDTPGAVHSLKPAAGDLVLYPSTTIHEVAPVTGGVRLACVGWIESLVRDPSAREILFDLENLRAELRNKLPANSAELLTLQKTISNLLRYWADPR